MSGIDLDGDGWTWPNKKAGPCWYCWGEVPVGEGEQKWIKRYGPRLRVRHDGAYCVREPPPEEVLVEAERQRLLVVEETEEEAEETEEEYAKRMEEYRERSRQEAERRWKEITAPPEGWTTIDGPERPLTRKIVTPEGLISIEDTVLPPRDQWVLEEQVIEIAEEGYLLRYADRYRAGPYVVLRYGSWDDERMAIMIPPQLLDFYMREEARRRGLTPADAREWLVRFRGAVGTALYEWVESHGEEAGE